MRRKEMAVHKLELVSIFVALATLTHLGTTNGQASHGHEYALVLPRVGSSSLDTYVTFTGMQDVMFLIRVTGIDYDEYFWLPVNGTYTLTFTPSWYVGSSTGTYSTVLYARADYPFRVSYTPLYSTSTSSTITADASLGHPRPLDLGTGNYTFPIPGVYWTHTSSSSGVYYMVAAYEDDTYFEMYTFEDGDMDLSLTQVINQTQVYVNYPLENINRKGFIVANKPIAVFSGIYSSQIQHSYSTSSFHYQFLHESMPRVENLGTEYISFPVIYGRSEPSSLFRILAFTDNTIVKIPLGISTIEFTLHRGKHFNFDAEMIIPSHMSIWVKCSHACQVTQQTKQSNAPSGGNPMSETFVSLIPVSQYAMSTIFSSPLQTVSDITAEAMLAIIVATEDVGDIYLNDTNIRHYNWEIAINGSASYLTLPVPFGATTLYTFDPASRFTAYVYTHTRGSSSMGYCVGYGVDEDEIATTTASPGTTTGLTTTTTAPLNGSITPSYRLYLHQTFTSQGGDHFTVPCNAEYTGELRQSADKQADYVNSEAGRSLCSTIVPGSLSLRATSPSFFTDQNLGFAAVSFLANVGDMPFSEVFDCMDEITIYLQDHNNWDPTTVVPPVPGCPVIVFDEDFFEDGRTGDNWVCPSSYEEEPMAHEWITSANPSFTFSIYDDFKVLGSLDLPCMQDYQDAWIASFANMNSEVASDIQSGRMCSDQHGHVHLALGQAIFTAQPTQGYIEGTFPLEASGQSATFNDMLQCADEVMDYVQPHSSWLDGVIPPPSGCPDLDFGPEQMFDVEADEWIC